MVAYMVVPYMDVAYMDVAYTDVAYTDVAYISVYKIYTFQKCIQNRPSTLRGQDKQLFVFWPFSVYDRGHLYGRTSPIWMDVAYME